MKNLEEIIDLIKNKILSYDSIDGSIEDIFEIDKDMGCSLCFTVYSEFKGNQGDGYNSPYDPIIIYDRSLHDVEIFNEDGEGITELDIKQIMFEVNKRLDKSNN